MRDRYGGTGSLQLYKAWQWNGSAYQFKEYSTDTWHCCTADLPWPALERIQYGYQGYPYWRSKKSYLDLATGGSERYKKYVLLNVSAWAYTSWNGVQPTGGYQLPFSAINIMGDWLNPDSHRFRQVDANTVLPVNLSTTASSYGFNVSVVPHKLQVLTASRHPGAANRDWQTAFDIGSDAMGKDDDGDGSSGDTEDQGCYVEFLIKPAANSLFPLSFQSTNYNNIRVAPILGNLAAEPFANIKTVSSIEVYDPVANRTNIYTGWVDSIPGTSAVLDSGAPAIVAVHEYGHLVGLDHRGAQYGNNSAGFDPDRAIMEHDFLSGNNEVNSYEVGYFESLSTMVVPLGL